MRWNIEPDHPAVGRMVRVKESQGGGGGWRSFAGTILAVARSEGEGVQFDVEEKFNGFFHTVAAGKCQLLQPVPATPKTPKSGT